jgi:hypothetical protein
MAERSVASVPDFTSGERLRPGPADPSGARDRLPPPFIETTTQESGLRENCTSRLSERAEAGRKPHLSRLYTDEASNNASRQVGGGERGGKAAGRRKGKDQRMPRTQSRTRHVPDGPSPRTGTGWAAQAPNTGRV